MKKKLLWMFIFSLIAHITVAGTLIYLPYQFYKNDKPGPSDNIIWSTVQNEATGSSKQAGDGKEKLEVRGKKLEAKDKKGGVIAMRRSREQSGDRAKQSVDELALVPKPLTMTNSKKTEVRMEKTDDGIRKEDGDGGLSDEVINQSGAGVDCQESIHCKDGIKSGDYADKDNIGDGNRNSSPGDTSDILNTFLERVRNEIDKNKHYPSFARNNGIEGTVYINFRIGGDGKLGSIGIKKSSGFKILDESAIRTIEGLKQASILPEEIQELEITVPIAYRLK